MLRLIGAASTVSRVLRAPAHLPVRLLLVQGVEAQRQQPIELQIGLKNYDPQRDKRFSGTIK
ncbi:hypothetical protein Rhopal_000925-T1 [Rhodotorula paludigena]|uniref:Uncharacterized protein n=1 Tax=Rhodotorula paludigena TaxID=86838 RepID=A0AAV5GDZ7_9BASI|nr:hypothetical protein Rhopal_000925-T1 [Rhodotorula paludigena]